MGILGKVNITAAGWPGGRIVEETIERDKSKTDGFTGGALS
jgi:hypothetical protein